jgi:hypothetical protein
MPDNFYRLETGQYNQPEVDLVIKGSGPEPFKTLSNRQYRGRHARITLRRL